MCKKLHYVSSVFLMLVLVLGVNAQTDPGTANLTHLWTFESGDPIDEVGQVDGAFTGENIYIENGDLVTVPGASDVGDSWLDLSGEDLALASYPEISVAAWFTPDSAYNTQWNSVWFFGNDGDGAGTGSDGICLQARRGDNQARFWFTSGVPAGYNHEDGVNDADYGNYNRDTTKYFVVCVVNVNGEIIMYHDGVLVGVTTLTTNPITTEPTAISDISPNFARFAHGGYAADNPWVGRIHEIAIYDKALSDEEIAFLYTEGGVTITSVENKDARLPEAFSLSQNYPNPFNPTTEITYTLNQSDQVKLIVFDALGREVETLVDGIKNPGMHRVTFNAHGLSSGIYYYQLRTGSGTLTKKMVLMK